MKSDDELIDFAKANLVFDGKNYHVVEEMQQRFGVGPIIVRFGAWAVTAYGLECLILADRKYPVQIATSSWIQEYIVEKSWHIPKDYQDEFKNDALNAVVYLSALMENEAIKPGQRFRILRRDNYRCQMCGRSAIEGAALEVDHKHPRAEGGSDEDANLWTLCFECNRGKSNLSL